MSSCCYGECPYDCMESDCNCQCHFTEDNSENSNQEELCEENFCPVVCAAFPGDCNCTCHAEARAAWCRIDYGPVACAVIEVTSEEEGNSAEESSDDEAN